MKKDQSFAELRLENGNRGVVILLRLTLSTATGVQIEMKSERSGIHIPGSYDCGTQ